MALLANQGQVLVFNNGVKDVVDVNGVSLVDEDKVAHVSGGSVTIDSHTIITNAEGKLEVPFDNDTIFVDTDGFVKAKAGEGSGVSKEYVDTELAKKQDVITDLEDIRDGASKGATALQEHQSLEGYATEEWVEGKGYLTEHQDISGKADKSYVDTELAKKQDTLVLDSETMEFKEGKLSAKVGSGDLPEVIVSPGLTYYNSFSAGDIIPEVVTYLQEVGLYGASDIDVEFADRLASNGNTQIFSKNGDVRLQFGTDGTKGIHLSDGSMMHADYYISIPSTAYFKTNVLGTGLNASPKDNKLCIGATFTTGEMAK